MNMFRLSLSNLKRYLRNPILLLPMILMPSILSIGVLLVSGNSDNSIYMPKVSVVCNLDGEYEKKLIKELEISDTAFDIKDKNISMDLLKNNEVSCVFILDENFSNDINNIVKPNVNVFKTESGGGSIWAESKIESFINTSLKYKIDPNINNKLITAKIISDEPLAIGNSTVSVFMICYCLYVCSAMFAKDLLDLRSSNVLRRMISTKNKDFEIIFSIFFALFLVQSLSCTVTLVLLKFIVGFELSLNMILIILANCFVSTGFTMALTRIFKTEAGVSFGSTFYSIISVALYMPTLLPSLNYKFSLLSNLAKISPVYWTFQSFRYDGIVLNLVALILIGLVFVTAGSFKLRDFAKN